MKRFFLKVNSLKVSKVASYSVSPMLTLTWGIDILFEKLTPEKGDGFENHPFTMSLGVCHAKPFFIFNTFSDDQHTDALIVGLF